MGIVGSFPPDWLIDVVALRGAGKDPKGNPLPVEEIPVTECLIVDRATRDPVDHSEVITATALMYRDPDPAFSFRPKDRIRVPAGSRHAGEWMVEGRPAVWPEGSEIGLVRG